MWYRNLLFWSIIVQFTASQHYKVQDECFPVARYLFCSHSVTAWSALLFTAQLSTELQRSSAASSPFSPFVFHILVVFNVGDQYRVSSFRCRIFSFLDVVTLCRCAQVSRVRTFVLAAGICHGLALGDIPSLQPSLEHQTTRVCTSQLCATPLLLFSVPY